MEKGSMIVLAIMATLILSLILAAGLSVSTTEAHTTQNFQMSKMSYYKAIEGLEIVTDMIRRDNDPSTINITTDAYDSDEGNAVRTFITGSLVDMEQGTTQGVKPFAGFDPPPLVGMSLGVATGIIPVLWYVPITAKVKAGKKTSYTELEAGVYSILQTAY